MTVRVPVLMYHDINDEPSVISVTPTRFDWQMRFLHELGYSVLSLEQLVTCLRADGTVPNRSVVLTFDDGFESTYSLAVPTLARYGFRATVFVVPDYVGGQNDWPGQPSAVPIRRLMSWEQVRELDRHGVEIGAHTRAHPRLDRLTPSAVADEILGSKHAIEAQLGRAVRHFAYPYGRKHASSRAVVAAAFDSACATTLGMVTSESDVFGFERIDAAHVGRPAAALGLSSPLFSVYLDLLRPVRQLRARLMRQEWA